MVNGILKMVCMGWVNKGNIMFYKYRRREWYELLNEGLRYCRY